MIVVPAGVLAAIEQPVFQLPWGYALRPWRDDDAGAFLAAGQDADIRRWNLLVVDSMDDARQRVERVRGRWHTEKGAIWAIASDADAAVGLIGWRAMDLSGGTAEIVYWLLPAARGQGLAVEATRVVSRWAFDELGLHRLTLCHSVHNPGSCRVALKSGYQYEGTMRSALLHADGWHDQHLHALVRGDRLS